MSAVAREIPQERYPPRVLARIYGSIGLFGIAAGIFDIAYVHNQIVIAGNAAATAQHLLAHHPLFGFGISVHLFMLLLNVVGEVIAYHIFRRVNPLLALLALACGLFGAATESLDLLASILPLQLVGAHAVGTLGAADLHVLAYLSSQLQDTGLLVSFAFWGLDELLLGYLIFRSGFLPRILGVLLAISGLVYFVEPLLTFGAAGFAALVFPAALALCLPGELLSALWMATMGLNVRRWRAWREPRAAAPRPA